MKRISQALDREHTPAFELSTILDNQLEGSCEWLTTNASFRSWLAGGFSQAGTQDPLASADTCEDSRVFWLSGPPGSGKSTAAAHVVRFLDSSNMDCSYFFFKGFAKTSIKQLLFSIVLQMTQKNFTVRQAILAMLDDGDISSTQDHTGIWNRIFASRIFKIPFGQPQFWVLDGLDECARGTLATLVQLIGSIDAKVPLRIFVSSRTNDSLERLFRNKNIHPISIRTAGQGSLQDISHYLKARLSSNFATRNTTAEDTSGLMSEILSKSNGIFLWVSLIVPMLEATYTLEEMREHLRRVPSEMSGLYSRILTDIQESPNAEIAHCILTWVVCAPRPLKTETLLEAVRFDLGKTLLSADNFAPICRNLILVDDGTVKLMHQTVKEFLTTAQSRNYISRPDAHAQLAVLCLRQLTDRKFLPPPSRRILAPGARLCHSPLDDYVFENFSHHLSHASCSTHSEEILSGLSEFAASNLTTWIEWTATQGKLSPFMQTIENIRAYLARYIQSKAPIEPEYQLVDALVGDLARVVSVFSSSLLDTPSSIYNLIPLLCPARSAFFSKFGKGSKQKLICSANEEWDERLSCLVFSKRVLSIACDDRYLALGMADGLIRLHSTDTLEPLSVLRHGSPVRRLCFGNLSSVLASCSPKTIVLWGKRHQEIWRASIPMNPLSIDFTRDDDVLLLPFKDATIWSFGVMDGRRNEPLPLPGDSSDSDDTDDSTRAQRRITPFLVRHSPILNLTAIAHRSSHLSLAQMDTNEMLGVFEKFGFDAAERPPQILEVAFSPAADMRVMAISYQDGDIVTIDPWSQTQYAEYHLYAQVLASSPDGRTLAAADNEGVISLFAFESLRLLGRISSLDDKVSGILFASSSLRFFDIRENVCNVWEPAVLIRKNTSDDSSSENDEAYLPVAEIAYTRFFDEARAITAMAHTPNGKFSFCGREDGSISVHSLGTGDQCAEILVHAKMVDLRFIEWYDKAKLLISADASGRYIGTILSMAPPGSWTQTRQLFDRRTGGSIVQLILDATGSFLLVSTECGEELLQLNTASVSSEPPPVQTEYSCGASRWMLHPRDPTRLLLVDGTKVHIFRWQGLQRETPEHGIDILLPVGTQSLTSLSNTWHSRKGEVLIQAISPPNSPETTVLFLDVAQIQPSKTEISALSATFYLQSGIKASLGIHRSNLYFLSRRGWVCSMSTKALNDPESYTRHFFLPPFWQTSGDLILHVVNKQDVVFANRDDLVVFQGFLDFESKVNLKDDGAMSHFEPSPVSHRGRQLVVKVGSEQNII